MTVNRSTACRIAMMLICFLMSANVVPGRPFNANKASFEDLLYHAQRYGNTEEKRVAKKAAQTELFARKGAALRYLMERIQIQNLWIRILAYQLTVKLDKDEAVPVLLDFVDSDTKEARKFSIYFLGFQSASEYADRIAPHLQDEYTAGAAIRTLGKWGAVEHLDKVASFLTDEDERKRVMAVNALCDMGDKRAIPLLQPALEDKYFTVRKTAERALHDLSGD